MHEISSSLFEMSGFRIIVKGVVQGVGFRPFVYTLARELGIKGYVTNTSEGVIIEAEGEGLSTFLKLLQERRPPLSRIDSIEAEKTPFAGYREFTILRSQDSGSFTLVSPDIAICPDCLR
ncbi:MAG: acylphosphatase, partial [Thermodesulfovibrionales bacterium]